MLACAVNVGSRAAGVWLWLRLQCVAVLWLRYNLCCSAYAGYLCVSLSCRRLLSVPWHSQGHLPARHQLVWAVSHDSNELLGCCCCCCMSLLSSATAWLSELCHLSRHSCGTANRVQSKDLGYLQPLASCCDRAGCGCSCCYTDTRLTGVAQRMLPRVGMLQVLL